MSESDLDNIRTHVTIASILMQLKTSDPELSEAEELRKFKIELQKKQGRVYSSYAVAQKKRYVELIALEWYENERIYKQTPNSDEGRKAKQKSDLLKLRYGEEDKTTILKELGQSLYLKTLREFEEPNGEATPKRQKTSSSSSSTPPSVIDNSKFVELIESNGVVEAKPVNIYEVMEKVFDMKMNHSSEFGYVKSILQDILQKQAETQSLLKALLATSSIPSSSSTELHSSVSPFHLNSYNQLQQPAPQQQYSSNVSLPMQGFTKPTSAVTPHVPTKASATRESSSSHDDEYAKFLQSI